MKRGVGYIGAREVTKSADIIDTWKVLFQRRSMAATDAA